MQPDDEDLADAPQWAGPMGDPAALAITSVVLGTLSLSGLGLLNGGSYIFPLSLGVASTTRLVLAGLLGAALALAAAVLGVVALHRAHPGDPGWVSRLAAAGALLAGTACVLRLVATGLAALQVGDTGYFAPL
ncbi:hypothetical protein BH24ACT10_BH24ACT10_08520 [soil metagenome]